MKQRIQKAGSALVEQWHRVCSPLFLLCLAGMLGIVTADLLPQMGPWTWVGLSALFLLLCFRSLDKAPSLWKMMMAGFLVFACSQASSENDALRKKLALRGEKPVLVKVSGLVMDEPQPSSTGAFWKLPLLVETLQGTSFNNVRLFVKIHAPAPPQYGDRLQLDGHLQQPALPRNPGEFDWAEYLHREGFSGELNVDGPQYFSILEKTGGSFLMRTALQSREWIGKTVTADLEDDLPIAATIRTMVLGTQESTPQDIEDAFVDSGTMHVFAVSGLHIALFGLVLGWALRQLRVPKSIMVAIIIPMMFFYVYITGLRPSAWRAAFMASVVLLGPLFNRESHVFTSLGFAALALLGWDPQQLFQAGFQLSFGVVFMLALLSQPMMRLLSSWHQPEPFLPHGYHSRWELWSCKVRKLVLESLVVSFAATLGSIPLMVHHFKLITPIGLVSNLFLVSLSSLILLTACLSILSASLKLPWLAIQSNNANWVFAKSSIWLAKFFSSIPGGHVQVDPAHWFDQSTARMTILSLQKGGGAAHLDCEGRHWMLDTGPATSFLFTQRPYLLRFPVTSLEGIVLTHHDAAHIGATGVLETTFPVASVHAPAFSKVSSLAAGSRPGQALAAGSKILLSEKASLSVLYPPPQIQRGLADDLCLVSLMEVAGWRILFTADAGFLAEKWILEHQLDVRADVWIKGRHTDDFSGLPEFVNAVKPSVVCFANSRFPMEESVEPAWKEMIARKGIASLDQAETGAVEISVSQTELKLKAFMTGKEQVLHH